MGISAAISQGETLPLKCRGEVAGVTDNTPLQSVEFQGLGDPESHCHSCELLYMGTSLLTGENCGFYTRCCFGICGQDHRSTRTADGLVSSEGDCVGNAHRRGMHASDNQSCGVGDVGHEECTHLVTDGAKSPPIRSPGIGSITSDHHLRSVLARQIAYLIIIQPAGTGINLVGGHMIASTRYVEGTSMCQMATVGQGHAHDSVAQFE